MSALDKAMAARAQLHAEIIKALAHLSREQAMAIILSWMSLDDIRKMLKAQK